MAGSRPSTRSQANASGYVTDVAYPSYFIGELAPAWLDFIVTLSGFAPPTREQSFTWCELGCGTGLTAALVAGTHPAAQCHAIDANEQHVALGRRLIDDSAISNLSLHGLDFSAARALDAPPFDYIVAHGVYSWIDARARDALLQFVDERLAPGGVVYLSYNALPGWANDSPFQFLVHALAADASGHADERFAEAIRGVELLTAAGAPALVASYMATKGWRDQQEKRPLAYFAHEYLTANWQPMYVTQVREQLATIGLEPAGSATAVDNFDRFVLKPAEREVLAAVTDPNLRELTRDFLIDQRFRRDVFVRSAPRITNEERAARLAHTWFDLTVPAELVTCELSTTAGCTHLGPRARDVVDALTPRPRPLADFDPSNKLRADVLALVAAGEVRPVEGDRAPVDRINLALSSRLEGPDRVPYLALPCGTAGEFPLDFLRARRNGDELSSQHSVWWRFLRRYES